MNSDLHKQIRLPAPIRALVEARNDLRKRYAASGLSFTLDGNLVGDLGEAMAHELFGVDLEDRSTEGIDGIAPDGRSVQVKASGTGRGPVFRQTRVGADHLIFFHFDFDHAIATVVYNGPEQNVIALLPSRWDGQRMVSITQVRAANGRVTEHQRLPMIRAE